MRSTGGEAEANKAAAAAQLNHMLPLLQMEGDVGACLMNALTHG